MKSRVPRELDVRMEPSNTLLAASLPAWQRSCPVPIPPHDGRITLAHGDGGRLSRQLLRDLILPALGNEHLAALDDAARLPRIEGRLAFTTDSFVVSPLFFPGGDIGSLAVFGTVNDLAVNGARPRWLTLSLILEEGLPRAVLRCVLQSVARAARQAEVQVVAGDTKVVPRGAADGLFINTAGIGELIEPFPPGPAHLQVGDELIVSGPIGRHGIAVLAAREDLAVDPPKSDAAPLLPAVESLRRALGGRVRAMRDATRGGVAAVLHEWSAACGHTLSVLEPSIPVPPEVRGACELLGLDPLHVANEGTMLVAVEAGAGEAALSALKAVPGAAGAALIGHVRPRGVAAVTVRRALGREQPLDDPLGAPLPRIC
jgi:hydrogenase expression/formation protein HypE